MLPKMIDDKNPEWTKEDFEKALSFSELPPDLQNAFRRFRGPQKKPTKIQTTIRLNEDILLALRATGKGWQTRVNDALRELLKEQRLG